MKRLVLNMIYSLDLPDRVQLHQKFLKSVGMYYWNVRMVYREYSLKELVPK
jgi:hypothetical protein